MENVLLRLQSSESFVGPDDFEWNYIVKDSEEYNDQYEILIYKIGIGKNVLNKREDLRLSNVNKKIVDSTIKQIIKIKGEISQNLIDGSINDLTINFNNKVYEYHWSNLIQEYSFIDDLINEIFMI